MTRTICVFAFTLLTSCFAAGASVAQDPPPPISQEKFESIVWNGGPPFAEVIGVQGDWTLLKQWLGEPTSEECTEDPSGELCAFEWDGIRAEFFWDRPKWYVLRFDVTSSAHSLFIDELQIGVGTSIHDLAPVFPDSYAARGRRCIGGECLHRLSFRVGVQALVVDFVYDPATELITEMRVQELWS